MLIKNKPLIVVCGGVKTGKSTEVFTAFQDSLAIVTSRNVLHYYKRLCKKNPSLKPPFKMKLIETSSVSSPSQQEPYSWAFKLKPIEGTFDQRAEFEGTLAAVLQQTKALAAEDKEPVYKNVVVDELNEILERAHKEFNDECRTSSGRPDTRSAFVALADWTGTIMSICRELTTFGVGVALTTHSRDPESGRSGGPKSPSRGTSAKISAVADGILRRYIKNQPMQNDGSIPKPKRLWDASASEDWETGLRGLEEDDDIAEMPLKEILELAGFDM